MSALDSRNGLVMVDIACNDPDSGDFAGRAEMLSIGSDLLELEVIRAIAPKFTEINEPEKPRCKVMFCRRIFPIFGSKYGVGNWCWNGYWFKIDDVVDMLAWLHQKRWYNCGVAEERIYNLWHRDEPFSARDREFLQRQLSKPSNYSRAA
jgi:hypothetical protein